MSIAKGQGLWVPIHLGFVELLPTDRSLSEPEAALSLQADYYRGNHVTVAGIAARWGWSRERVRNFLKTLGASIEYPESTGLKQNQRGQITLQITGRTPTDHRQIKLIDNRHIEHSGDRSPTDRQQITDRSPSTTIKTKEVRHKKEKKEKKPFSPEALRLSGRLADLILQNLPGHTALINGKRDATVQRWADDIEKLHRIDGQSWRDVELVIEWCQEDEFWKTIILSASALRKQWNKLAVKEVEEREKYQRRDPFFGCVL